MSKVKQTVIVITKGRTEKPATIQMLQAVECVDLVILSDNWIEAEFYKRFTEKSYVQELREYGHSGALQSALNYLRNHKIEHGIISDDDISKIFVNNPIGVKDTLVESQEDWTELFKKMQIMSRELNLGMLSLSFNSGFQKFSSGKLAINQRLATVFVLYNNNLIPNDLEFDLRLKVYSDYDFMLNLIKRRINIASSNHYSLRSGLGTKGGLKSVYEDHFNETLEDLINKWGEELFLIKDTPKDLQKYVTFNTRNLKNIQLSVD